MKNLLRVRERHDGKCWLMVPEYPARCSKKPVFSLAQPRCALMHPVPEARPLRTTLPPPHHGARVTPLENEREESWRTFSSPFIHDRGFAKYQVAGTRRLLQRPAVVKREHACRSRHVLSRPIAPYVEHRQVVHDSHAVQITRSPVFALN
jgi:hypothetical protein